MPLHVSSTSAHRQEAKIVLYSLWYHHTETSEWSKITKITKITKILLHVSAVTRPSSGQQGIVLLRYTQLVFPMGSHCLQKL